MDNQDAAQEIARLEALIAIQGATLERYEKALQEIKGTCKATKKSSGRLLWIETIAEEALKEAE